MILLIILVVVVIFAFGFMLWTICAAGPKDTLDYQMECLRKEYAQKQRNKTRVKVDDNFYL